MPPHEPERGNGSSSGIGGGLSAGGKEDLSARYGDRGSLSDNTRRPSPARARTDDDETVVEKMWQPLFDSRGEPTPRVGQFLRGLALHLVCIPLPRDIGDMANIITD
jgi:hypothetical protein